MVFYALVLQLYLKNGRILFFPFWVKNPEEKRDICGCKLQRELFEQRY